MSSLLWQEKAKKVLEEEADKILQIIENQQYHLCIAQCKAFEEVIDTQMYGYSRQIMYAVKIDAISQSEGAKMLAHLEHALNQMYNEVYDEQREDQRIQDHTAFNHERGLS